jgi:C2 domain
MPQRQTHSHRLEFLIPSLAIVSIHSTSENNDHSKLFCAKVFDRICDRAPSVLHPVQLALSQTPLRSNNVRCQRSVSAPTLSPLHFLIYRRSQIAAVARRSGSQVSGQRPTPLCLISHVLCAVVAADGLSKRDVFRLPDPFAVITVDAEQTHTTSVIKKTLNPYWNESFDM